MTVALGEKVESVEDFLEHYGVKGMKWGKRRVRPDEAERKARFGPRAKKIALGSAAVAGAAVVAALAARNGGVKVTSLGGLTDRNSSAYNAMVAGKKAANYTMSAARNTKVSDIPNATQAIASNPQLRALTAGAKKTSPKMNVEENRKMMDDIRAKMDDPDYVWEL